MHCTFSVAVCSQGDIRLSDGANSRQGRVEVCDSNAWGTVCSIGFDVVDATVVCTQLGRSGIGTETD